MVGEAGRRDGIRFPPGSLVPARPPDLGVGSVWVPPSGCRFPEVPGAGKREVTARKSTHSSLRPQPSPM